MSDLHGFGFVLPHWLYWGWLAFFPLVLLYLDSKSKHRVDDLSPSSPGHPDHPEEYDVQGGDDPLKHYEVKPNIFTRSVDWACEHSGVFVALWTVNAVCFYFYEVIMRYVFNMPTIWVHESSYLLLGMQYLMAGAYTLLHGGHVRVDVMYNYLPVRGRVGVDIFTSMFFFIFALALAGTSWVYFRDAYGMGERSIETWGIQFYPIKGMMFLGAMLLLLAGVSKVIKDIKLFIQMGRGNVL